MPGLLSGAHKRGLILIGPTRFFPFRRTPHHGYAPLCKPGWTSTVSVPGSVTSPSILLPISTRKSTWRPKPKLSPGARWRLLWTLRPGAKMSALCRSCVQYGGSVIVALISARAQQNQSYADSAPHNQVRHIICAFRRLALIWASVAVWGLSAFFHIGVGGRGGRALRTEHAEQEIDDFRPVVRRDRGAPARHLVHFALPLRAGEMLPRDHVLAMAAQARLLHLVRERRDIGGGRLRRQSGRTASHLHAHCGDHVP